jgi:tetratricopeptide (TPR) repeat protein
MVSAYWLQTTLQAGLDAHRRGDLAAAQAAYREVLASSPGQPDALHLSGLALLQTGEPAQALPLLQQAARSLREHAGAHGHLGQAYFALGHYAEAQEAFRQAARLQPDAVQFPLGSANAMALQKKFADAEALLRKLAARFPQEALVWFNLGNVQRDQARPEDALESLRRAHALDPALLDAHNNLAGALYALERFDDAEAEYRALIARAPDYPLAPVNLASLLIDVGRCAEAETLCRDVIRRHPAFAQAHTFLGAALGHQGRLLDALECYRAAAALAPQDLKAQETIAGALTDLGRLREGLPAYLRVLPLAPAVAGAASGPMAIAGALLRHGRLREGWTAYAERPAAVHAREKYRATRFARTFPAQLQGLRVTLQREQGLGDELFFLRYAPPLAAAGVQVTYRTGRALQGMLDRSPVFARVIADSTPLPGAQETDLTMLVGDLPHAWAEREAAATGAAVLPALPQLVERLAADPQGDAVLVPAVPPPFALAPLPDRMAEWTARLAAFGPAPYVGLTWRAGTPPQEQRGALWMMSKQVPRDALAAALREVPGTLIALQRHPAPGEIDAFAAALGRPVHDLTALNGDLEAMLAVLSLLDEYVAVSNTNVHLRASAGRASRVLVPSPAEWRWLAAGRASPWFPDTVVYRQTLNGDWKPALAELQRDLLASAR